MTVSRDDIVFAFDFSRVETVGGVRYLYDYGPNGLHAAFPGGAADPTPQLDGSLLFTAAPQYLSLPLRYYTYAPTREYTWLGVYRTTAVAASAVMFSSYSLNGGLRYGTTFIDAAAVLYDYANQGGAGEVYVRIIPFPIAAEKKVVAVTTEAAPRALKNQQVTATAPAWVGGAFGTVAYDATKVPLIGRDPALWSGAFSCWYLCQIRGALSSPDLSLYSRLLSEGVQKPWAVR